jgi:hypothetical protein
MSQFLLNFINNIPLSSDLFCENFKDSASLPPSGLSLFITEDSLDFFLTEDGLDNFITE